MEVFMRGLPNFVSEKALEENLKPRISKLGIDRFGCQKRGNATTGNIIFVTPSDGEKFLTAYGAVRDPTNGGVSVPWLRGNPRQKARLRLFDSNVFCDKGRGVPNKITIESIQYKAGKEREQRQWEASHKSNGAQHDSVVFEMWELSCGYLAYPEGECAYREDMRWGQRQPSYYGGSHPVATAKFAKSSLILKLLDGRQVDVSFNGIEQVVASDRDSSLILILTEIPKFYTTNDLITGLDRLSIAEESDPRKQSPSKFRTTDLGGEQKHMIGAGIVYRIQVSSADFATKVRRLQTRPFISEVINAQAYIPRLGISMMEHFPPLGESLGTLNKRLEVEAKQAKLPFGVLFQLQVLAWNAYLHPNTVIKILDSLKARQGTSRPIPADSLKKLLRDIPFPGPDTDAELLAADGIVDWLEHIEQRSRSGSSLALDSIRENEHLVWIYKALVTPTHVILSGPELEARNRVLRKFPDHTDHFVRVQFGEEDGSDIRFNPKVSNDLVYARFKKILTDGISIGGRRYTFFGFSHSSLRSHSTWFLAPFTHEGTLRFYNTIILGLGDFKNIRVVAKCAARIGQAFSETPYAVNMKECGIEHTSIPDIKSPDGSRVFSDGVGTMSTEAQLKISANLPNGTGATVYQIRFGGSKGVISLDSRLSGNLICIRSESMEKFASNDTDNLEICGMANRPIRLVLNRQNIKILEDMGVPPDWFLGLQATELNRLQGATKSIFNTSVFLAQQSIGDSIEFPKFLKRLERLGIDFKADRLLCGIVESVVLQELRLLKHKARIPVPQGITLYGIIDETGFLEEGEVYVTFESYEGLYDRAPSDKAPLLVTRSPALHPGDIQRAVNRVPPDEHPLGELANCIVFNRKGNRDLPSMLSGGDLDGDLYHIIWDPKLAFDQLQVFEPADYSPQPAQDLGRNVEREDMAHFMIDFMKTDQLGLISVRHMILADQEELGSVHGNCKRLAELASTAVDFSKSGIPADVDRLREIRSHRARPDFLASAPPVEFVDFDTIIFESEAPIPQEDEDEDSGAQYQYYRSKKILGRLFRAVKEEKIWHDSVNIKAKRDKTKLWVELRDHVDAAVKCYGLKWSHRTTKAQGLRTMYEEAVQNAMTDNAEYPHKPLSEVELFIGQVFNKRGAQTRRQRDCSDKLRDTFARISSAIWRMIRERPSVGDDESAAGSIASAGAAHPAADKSVLELAAACFYVSLQESGVGVGRRHSQQWRVESFKILAANVFLKELEMYQKAEDIRLGVDITSGGYLGVGGGPRRGTYSGRRGSRRRHLLPAPNVAEPPSIASSLNSSLRMIPPQVDI
ncbi:RNA-dependent RNA polymerase [Zalerion maritima]|uniref:RNA-dependent RNA polymerase n=1 Tax=Zalerion maritima TaxID=339359 RepID=A0AAD5RPJ1_9PEZI|nr:RNA-dependent RNA polymerase [Zalerion maritima]